MTRSAPQGTRGAYRDRQGPRPRLRHRRAAALAAATERRARGRSSPSPASCSPGSTCAAGAYGSSASASATCAAGRCSSPSTTAGKRWRSTRPSTACAPSTAGPSSGRRRPASAPRPCARLHRLAGARAPAAAARPQSLRLSLACRRVSCTRVRDRMTADTRPRRRRAPPGMRGEPRMSESSKIRNVALVGHRGAGKTSLLEALLFGVGAVTRQGKVEDGTTVGDWDDDEKRRQLSLASSLAHIEAGGLTYNLIDTPGDSSFQSDTIGALRVVETAVVVVNSVMGVEVQTERLWNRAADAGLARIVFCNMLDRERADFDRCLAALREAFGHEVAAVQLPIGSEHEFKGVVDVLTMKAYTLDGHEGRRRATYRPSSPTRRRRPARPCSRSWPRAATSSPRSSSWKRRSAKTSSSRASPQAVREAKIFPVAVGAATKLLGVDQLLKLLALAPSPDAAAPPTLLEDDGTEVETRLRRRQAGRGVRLQDRRRPVQRPHQRVPRLPGHRHRQQRAGRCTQRPQGAFRSAAQAAGQGDEADRQGRRRRHRRRRQAQGRRHGRHAPRRRRQGRRSRRSPTRRRSCPSPSRPRPRATRTRSCRRSSGSPKKTP